MAHVPALWPADVTEELAILSSENVTCTASDRVSVAVLTFSDQERPGALVVIPPEDNVVFDVACILQASRVSRRLAADSRKQGEVPLLAVGV